MKVFHKIYVFLASVYFAIILIASVIVFVIAGTIIESLTKSHLYAASLIYENPIFDLILSGFFINILFSALRRWPFKIRHIPFLTTHLGLLMIISGVAVKLHFGVQGTLYLTEGSGSHELYEANTYALSLQSKDKKNPDVYPLSKTDINKKFKLITEDNGWVLRQIDFTPNSREVLNSWIKGSFATISGLRPQPLLNFDKDNLIASAKVRFSENGQEFDFYAIKTEDLEATLKALYHNNSKVVLSKNGNEKSVQSFKLADLINSFATLEDGSEIRAELKIPVSALHDVKEAKITFLIDNREVISIPLTGLNALENINLSTAYLGKNPVTIDIETRPIFALVQDIFNDVHMIVIDKYGFIKIQKYEEGIFDKVIAYDNGFSGYGTKAINPFEGCNASREAKEQGVAYYLYHQIQKAEKTSSDLVFPLKLFQTACKNQSLDFAETLTLFLLEFHRSHSWLYPKERDLNPNLKQVFNDESWNAMPLKIKKGCDLAETFFEGFSKDLERGINPHELLVKANWPLLDTFSSDDINNPNTLLTKVTEQIFSAASHLEALVFNQKNEQNYKTNANHFSALLRSHQIDFDHLIDRHNRLLALSNESIAYSNRNDAIAFGRKDLPDVDFPSSLETEIVPYHTAILPTNKIEDNAPCLLISATKGKTGKKISLRYDKSGRGLRFPILEGQYLARFQPNTHSIPYHVRLRQARQINYPNSKQAYSYESDLIITDLKTKQEVEKTISMNDVHETWDGYRFYLSSISGDDASLKQIQVVVNRDMAKYWLTYPGGIILTCGILALFIMRPYRKS